MSLGRESKCKIYVVLIYSHLNDKELLTQALYAKHTLLKTGVAFKDRKAGEVPWLVSPSPFHISATQGDKLQKMAETVFIFIDAIQALYAEGEPTVKQFLDMNISPELRGAALEKPIETFRLDVIIKNGNDYITEIEECYGTFGILCAMEIAYNIVFERFFESFSERELQWVYLDDAAPFRQFDINLLVNRLKKTFGLEVKQTQFSQFSPHHQGTAWRFCYTHNLVQYPIDKRHEIISSANRFFNPLFHGFASKAMLALAHVSSISGELISKMGQERFNLLRQTVPETRLIELGEDPRSLYDNHQKLLLKVVSCPGGQEFEWGSRGVYFGTDGKPKWKNYVDAAVSGKIPHSSKWENVRYIISNYVESDRFDVPFLHPITNELALMTKARTRLGPIFFRNQGKVELVGGEATFVNTSKKVHIGQHAVCVPLQLQAG